MTRNEMHHQIWPPLWQRIMAGVLSVVSIAMVLAALTLLFLTHPAMTFICLLAAAGIFWLVGRLTPPAPVSPAP